MTNFVQKGRLSKQEVELLVRDMQAYQSMSVKGEITKDGGSYDSNFRECDVHFINPYKFHNTGQILQSTLIQSYQHIYPDFDYSRMSSFQYVKYEKGGFFGKHKDIIKSPPHYQRSLTMSINLSNQQEYEGGDLIVDDPVSKEMIYCDKEIGSYMVFPAFYVHEATLVTAGKREAVVTWLLTDHEKIAMFQQRHKDFLVLENM